MLLVSAQMLTSVIYMGLLFVAGLTLSLVTASTAIRLPSKTSILSYNNLPIPSLARKSVLDVSRSSGGLLKIIMSMFILLGLYWYIVNYIPLASYLLSNPLMSFAVVLGMMSVTVYNWLNTYDELENYQYLPVDKRELLKSKFQAFKLISTIIITLLISSSYLLYGGDLILSLAIALTTAYYIGAVTMFESGLNPNEKMINGWVFTKFLIIVNILVIPLLALTSLNVDSHVIIGLLVPMLVIGKIAEKIKIG